MVHIIEASAEKMCPMVHIIEASAEKMCPIGSAPYILYIGAEVKSLVDSIKE